MPEKRIGIASRSRNFGIAEPAGIYVNVGTREKKMNNHQSRRDFCATAIATIFASATAARAAEKK
jgi:hypothetical protein